MQKKRTGPGSRTGAAARSGPNIPTSQRKRRPLEITLGAEARALLDAEATRTEETRSALVEALVLSHLQAERYLPPALVEGVQARATARGIDYHAALAEAVAVGLHAPPAAAGGLTLTPEHAAAVQALAADRSASPAEVLGELVQSGLRAEIARRERRR